MRIQSINQSIAIHVQHVPVPPGIYAGNSDGSQGADVLGIGIAKGVVVLAKYRPYVVRPLPTGANTCPGEGL